MYVPPRIPGLEPKPERDGSWHLVDDTICITYELWKWELLFNPDRVRSESLPIREYGLDWQLFVEKINGKAAVGLKITDGEDHLLEKVEVRLEVRTVGIGGIPRYSPRLSMRKGEKGEWHIKEVLDWNWEKMFGMMYTREFNIKVEVFNLCTSIRKDKDRGCSFTPHENKDKYKITYNDDLTLCIERSRNFVPGYEIILLTPLPKFHCFMRILRKVPGGLNDDIVEDVLELGRRYETGQVIDACVEYLMNESKKTLYEKWRLSDKYKLYKLKNNIRAQFPTEEKALSAIDLYKGEKYKDWQEFLYNVSLMRRFPEAAN